MRKEVWIGKKGFRYWYYRFRDSELYSLTIITGITVLCLCLLFYWIIPELNNWFSIRQEVLATRQHIAILQQNITFIKNVNKNSLNQQLQIATEALPAERDFGAILNAISNASVNSGLSLNEYSFHIGKINSSRALANNNAQSNGLQSIQVTLTVNGSIDQCRRFIQSLENSLPLSEVTKIDGSNGNISITIQFYQKPFSSSNFSPETPLTTLSTQQSQLLDTLSKWQTTINFQNIPAQTSSGSAIPLF